MKGSENFKKVIKDFLEKQADTHLMFLMKLDNPKKNIDDCITYILNTVKKMEVQGFTDSEIYGMALHYYDEENIDIGKKISANVVVNHQVELTADEIKEAKDKAYNQVMEEQRQKMLKKPKSTVVVNKDEVMPGTLF